MTWTRRYRVGDDATVEWCTRVSTKDVRGVVERVTSTRVWVRTDPRTVYVVRSEGAIK